MDKKVLITDGRTLSALAVARSLGEAGHLVHCGESFRSNLTRFSKHLDRAITYPSPDEEPERFLTSLLQAFRRTDYDLVIPTRGATTRLLAKHRDRIEPLAAVFLADCESVERFADKGETIRLARQVGTPVPQTRFPEDTPIETIAAEISYPALVRARRASGSRGIVRVNSLGEVADAYEKVKREHSEPIAAGRARRHRSANRSRSTTPTYCTDGYSPTDCCGRDSRSDDSLDCSTFCACPASGFATGPSRTSIRWSSSGSGHRACPSCSTGTCDGRFSGVRPPIRLEV